MPASGLDYNRVLLKISGEALASPDPLSKAPMGLSQEMLFKVASDIKKVHDTGVQVCLVVGGGNIYRGATGSREHGIDRVTSDYMGMLATVINGAALQNALTHVGLDCRLMSALHIPQIAETYIREKAHHHLNKGRIVLFVAGCGNPYFTTDTAAALRASELNCDLLLKATKVDGVYTHDPIKQPDAKRFTSLKFTQVREERLNVMDQAAFALCDENTIPIAVFSVYEEDGFYKVISKTNNHTLITF